MTAVSLQVAPTRRSRRPFVLATVGLLLLSASGLAACSDEPERSTPASCAQLTLAAGLDEALATADATALDTQSAALRQAVKVAPSDIQPAVAMVSANVDALLATIGTATGDRRGALTEALRARESEADALTAAGTAVAAWTATNCGLDLDSGATVPTTAMPPDAAPAAPITPGQ